MAPTTRASKRRATEGPLGAPEPSPLATASGDDVYAESSNGRADTPEPEVGPEHKPARKGARRSQKDKGSSAPKVSKPGRVKGKLEMFKNVPVEVFIEIAKYLHPFDLVLLSRVNKFFRELFMSRQAASIWISAQQNVPDLPPCPPELCEPQYAALLFTKMCSQCGKYAPRHMDPVLLVRLCSKCRDEEYKLGWTMINKITDYSLIIFSSQPPPRSLRRSGQLFLSRDVEAVLSKLQELKTAGDLRALVSWQIERRKAVEARYTSAKLFAAWFAARDSEREDNLNQRKDAHEAEVTARLISLGWEQADHLPSYNPRRKQWCSLVRAAKVLTDRAWDKLLPQLQVHLETNRRERLEREHATRREERQDRLYAFWHKAKKELFPLLQAMPQPNEVDTASLPATVVQHYTGKKSEWNSQSKVLANRPTNEFTYIFTHDMKVEKPNKPLVRIVDGNETPAPPTYAPWVRKTCLACNAIGTHVTYRDGEINDHLLDAHLIEEPEQGKHFR